MVATRHQRLANRRRSQSADPALRYDYDPIQPDLDNLEGKLLRFSKEATNRSPGGVENVTLVEVEGLIDDYLLTNPRQNKRAGLENRRKIVSIIWNAVKFLQAEHGGCDFHLLFTCDACQAFGGILPFLRYLFTSKCVWFTRCDTRYFRTVKVEPIERAEDVPAPAPAAAAEAPSPEAEPENNPMVAVARPEVQPEAPLQVEPVQPDVEAKVEDAEVEVEAEVQPPVEEEPEIQPNVEAEVETEAQPVPELQAEENWGVFLQTLKASVDHKATIKLALSLLDKIAASPNDPEAVNVETTARVELAYAWSMLGCHKLADAEREKIPSPVTSSEEEGKLFISAALSSLAVGDTAQFRQVLRQFGGATIPVSTVKMMKKAKSWIDDETLKSILAFPDISFYFGNRFQTLSLTSRTLQKEAETSVFECIFSFFHDADDVLSNLNGMNFLRGMKVRLLAKIHRWDDAKALCEAFAAEMATLRNGFFVDSLSHLDPFPSLSKDHNHANLVCLTDVKMAATYIRSLILTNEINTAKQLLLRQGSTNPEWETLRFNEFQKISRFEAIWELARNNNSIAIPTTHQFRDGADRVEPFVLRQLLVKCLEAFGLRWSSLYRAPMLEGGRGMWHVQGDLLQNFQRRGFDLVCDYLESITSTDRTPEVLEMISLSKRLIEYNWQGQRDEGMPFLWKNANQEIANVFFRRAPLVKKFGYQTAWKDFAVLLDLANQEKFDRGSSKNYFEQALNECIASLTNLDILGLSEMPQHNNTLAGVERALKEIEQAFKTTSRKYHNNSPRNVRAGYTWCTILSQRVNRAKEELTQPLQAIIDLFRG